MIGRTDEKPYNPIPWHGAPRDLTGDNQLGPYTRELTQRYVCGTRFATWDAKVFRYARTLTGSTCVNSQGAFNRCGVVNIAVSGSHAVIAGDHRVHEDVHRDERQDRHASEAVIRVGMIFHSVAPLRAVDTGGPRRDRAPSR